MLKKLRPELPRWSFPKSPDREFSCNREIKVEESRPVDAIAAGIAEQIRAYTWPLGSVGRLLEIRARVKKR